MPGTIHTDQTTRQRRQEVAKKVEEEQKLNEVIEEEIQEKITEVDEPDFNSLSFRALRKIAKSRGIKIDGTKEELLARIKE